MQKKKEKADDYFDLEDLKKYMSLSTEEKLNHLEEMNEFFVKIMPLESKRIWEELKKTGRY